MTKKQNTSPEPAKALFAAPVVEYRGGVGSTCPSVSRSAVEDISLDGPLPFTSGDDGVPDRDGPEFVWVRFGADGAPASGIEYVGADDGCGPPGVQLVPGTMAANDTLARIEQQVGGIARALGSGGAAPGRGSPTPGPTTKRSRVRPTPAEDAPLSTTRGELLDTPALMVGAKADAARLGPRPDDGVDKRNIGLTVYVTPTDVMHARGIARRTAYRLLREARHGREGQTTLSEWERYAHDHWGCGPEGDARWDAGGRRYDFDFAGGSGSRRSTSAASGLNAARASETKPKLPEWLNGGRKRPKLRVARPRRGPSTKR